jgi:hypothetical protein
MDRIFRLKNELKRSRSYSPTAKISTDDLTQRIITMIKELQKNMELLDVLDMRKEKNEFDTACENFNRKLDRIVNMISLLNSMVSEKPETNRKLKIIGIQKFFEQSLPRPPKRNEKQYLYPYKRNSILIGDMIQFLKT